MARLEYAYQGDTYYHVVQRGTYANPSTQVPAVLFGGLATSFGNTKVDAQGITNLRIAVGGENWRVTAFARNLTDEEYIAEVIMAPEFGGAFVHPAWVRSAGVELEYRF